MTTNLGPYTLTPVKTGRPKGDIYRVVAICNGTVIAEECISQRAATYVRGRVTYGQERIILDAWHRIVSAGHEAHSADGGKE